MLLSCFLWYQTAARQILICRLLRGVPCRRKRSHSFAQRIAAIEGLSARCPLWRASLAEARRRSGSMKTHSDVASSSLRSQIHLPNNLPFILGHSPLVKLNPLI